MKCPKCHKSTFVLGTRQRVENVVTRRRVCYRCDGYRFTTKERPEIPAHRVYFVHIAVYNNKPVVEITPDVVSNFLFCGCYDDCLNFVQNYKE